MKLSLISSTGPLLALSCAGLLDLVNNLYGRILVPEAVDIELKKGGKQGLGLSGYLKSDWIEVHPQGTIDPLLQTQLDEGEAAVTLALKRDIDFVLIDERKARKIARMIYGLNVIGTAGILIKSKKAGLILNVKARPANFALKFT